VKTEPLTQDFRLEYQDTSSGIDEWLDYGEYSTLQDARDAQAASEANDVEDGEANRWLYRIVRVREDLIT
jgi:hypothetical protein